MNLYQVVMQLIGGSLERKFGNKDTKKKPMVRRVLRGPGRPGQPQSRCRLLGAHDAYLHDLQEPERGPGGHGDLPDGDFVYRGDIWAYTPGKVCQAGFSCGRWQVTSLDSLFSLGQPAITMKFFKFGFQNIFLI